MEKPIYKKATVQGLVVFLAAYFAGPDFADLLSFEQSHGLMMAGLAAAGYGFQRRFPSAEKTP